MKVEVHWAVISIEHDYVRCCSVWKDEDSAEKDCENYKSLFPEYAAVERYDVIKIEIEKKCFWDKINPWKKTTGQPTNG